MPEPSPGSAGGEPSARQVVPLPWEHETSDLPVHPGLRFGHLQNGLRYAWMRNSTPLWRCSLRLHVRAGSLREDEAERGMAHLLEHLLFGAAVETIQALGVEYGREANAQTGFWETIYSLELPQTNEPLLSEALGVFRGFAQRLELDPERLRSELAVIDAEERERLSSSRRLWEAKFARLCEGSLGPKRLPLGVREARDAFVLEAVTEFHRRFYRPELITLVAVGDFGEIDLESLIAQVFGELPSVEDPVPSEPDPGSPHLRDRVFSLHEPEAAEVTMTLERLRAAKRRGYDRDFLSQMIPLSLVHHVLQARLEERMREEGSTLLEAQVGDNRWAEILEGPYLQVASEPNRWQDSLELAVSELRGLIEHGILEREWRDHRRDLQRDMDEEVEEEKTRDSRSYADELIEAAGRRHVVMQAEDQRRIVMGILDGLDPDVCRDLYAKAWRGGKLSLIATGRQDIAQDELQEALKTSRRRPARRRDDEEGVVFAYASTPADATSIENRVFIEDLDVHHVTLANGIELYVKKTDFVRRDLLVVGRLGRGLSALSPDRGTLAWMVPALNGCGLARHDDNELTRLLSGKIAEFAVSLASDHLSMVGQTTQDDLLFQCELMAAFLRDPGWRRTGWDLHRRDTALMYDALEHDHEGPLELEFRRDLYGGDPRFHLPRRSDLLAVSLEDLRDWMGPQLDRGPITMAVVGDQDVDASIAAVCQGLGSLQKRQSVDEKLWLDVAYGQGGLKHLARVDVDEPSSLFTVVLASGDGIDVSRRRSLHILARVLQERLRLAIREDRGEIYSMNAESTVSRVFPGVGAMEIAMKVDSSRVEECLDVTLDLVDEMGRGVSEDELSKVLVPFRNQLRDVMRNNHHWARVLTNIHSRSDAFDEIRSFPDFVQNLTTEKLAPVAAETFQRSRASISIVHSRRSHDSVPIWRCD